MAPSSSTCGFPIRRRFETPTRRGGSALPRELGSADSGRGRRHRSARLRRAVRCARRRGAAGRVVGDGRLPAGVCRAAQGATYRLVRDRTTVEGRADRRSRRRGRHCRAGMEAGGHRGAFDAATVEREMVGLFSLLPAIVDSVGVPVIATGGIADGRASPLRWRSAPAPSSRHRIPAMPRGTDSSAWAEAIGRAAPEDTVVSRAFSGRSGRSIATAYAAPRPGGGAGAGAYPVQRGLTAAMRRRGQDRRHRSHAGVGRTVGGACARGTGERARRPALGGGPGAAAMSRLAATATALRTAPQRRDDDFLRLVLNAAQVLFAADALGVHLVHVLGAGRAGGEPAALRDHLDAAERMRRCPAPSSGLLGSARRRDRHGHVLRGQRAEERLLLGRCGCVDRS